VCPASCFSRLPHVTMPTVLTFYRILHIVGHWHMLIPSVNMYLLVATALDHLFTCFCSKVQGAHSYCVLSVTGLC
jgi:hypothetical protein